MKHSESFDDVKQSMNQNIELNSQFFIIISFKFILHAQYAAFAYLVFAYIADQLPPILTQ